MDPEVCMQEVMQELRTDPTTEKTKAKIKLEEYREWRANGGFEPTVEVNFPGDVLAAMLAHLFNI